MRRWASRYGTRCSVRQQVREEAAAAGGPEGGGDLPLLRRDHHAGRQRLLRFCGGAVIG